MNQESHTIQISQPPHDLAGDELQAWQELERQRMCAEMHALADQLFGTSKSDDLRRALADALRAAIVPPKFTWHSTAMAEDGTTLSVFYDGPDGRTWGFTIDTTRPLPGQPVTFRRLD